MIVRVGVGCLHQLVVVARALRSAEPDDLPAHVAPATTPRRCRLPSLEFGAPPPATIAAAATRLAVIGSRHGGERTGALFRGPPQRDERPRGTCRRCGRGARYTNPAATYSPGVSPQVPSALAVFTSVFGMGTGVSPPLLPPEIWCACARSDVNRWSSAAERTRTPRRRIPSPRPISTGRLNTSPCLHLRPIYLVVFQGPYPVVPVGDLISRTASRSVDAFSAHLFLPQVANQPCSWRNNWHTRAASVPVLSYWGQLLSAKVSYARNGIGTELSRYVLNPQPRAPS